MIPASEFLRSAEHAKAIGHVEDAIDGVIVMSCMLRAQLSHVRYSFHGTLNQLVVEAVRRMYTNGGWRVEGHRVRERGRRDVVHGLRAGAGKDDEGVVVIPAKEAWENQRRKHLEMIREAEGALDAAIGSAIDPGYVLHTFSYNMHPAVERELRGASRG